MSDVVAGTSISLVSTYFDQAGGDPVDPTDLELVIKRAGTVVDGPVTVGTGIVRDSLGLYRYTYNVPLLAVSDVYTAEWTGNIDGEDVTGYETFNVLAAGDGLWASLADVTAITGELVADENEIRRAQAIISMSVSRMFGDLGTMSNADGYWLKLATAYQTVWMQTQFDIWSRVSVTSLSQDGLTMASPDWAIAPLAKMALARCSWNRSRSIRAAAPRIRTNATIRTRSHTWKAL